MWSPWGCFPGRCWNLGKGNTIWTGWRIIIHNLYSNGIFTILATPSAARPAWMAQKYPEVRRVRSDRTRELFRRRQNYCYTSPLYREKVRAIDEQLARRFGEDPAVILWHISNEMGGDCHCPLCQAEFRRWLQRRYGSLGALNKAWNARFWSHDYTDWEQIESPAPQGEDAVQGLLLDWKRFVSSRHIDFFKFERDCVRALAPKARFTANLMYRFHDIDYHDLARELDVVSWDNYPTWHKATETVEQTALDTAMMHDLFYSLKGKPFLMMESSPSFTNWQPVTKQKKPGMAMRSALQAVAHGSDSVCYFQWRASRGAEEKFHGSVVGHDGRSDTRIFRETSSGRRPHWRIWPVQRAASGPVRRPWSMTGPTSGPWRGPAAPATVAWVIGRNWPVITTLWLAPASRWT